MRRHYLSSSSEDEFSDPDMELAMKSLDLSRLKTSATTAKTPTDTGTGRVSASTRLGASANRLSRPTMGGTAPAQAHKSPAGPLVLPPAPGPSRSQASTTGTKDRTGPKGVRNTKNDWSEIEIPRAPPTPDSLSSLSSLALLSNGNTPSLSESDTSPAQDVASTVPKPSHPLSQDQEMDELDSGPFDPAEPLGVATEGTDPDTTLKNDGLISSPPAGLGMGALPDQSGISETTVHPANPSQDLGKEAAQPKPSSSTQDLPDLEDDELSSSAGLDDLLLDIPFGALDAAERAELLF